MADDERGGPDWKPWLAGLVAAAVVGVVAGLVYVGTRGDETPPVANPTASETTPAETTPGETSSPDPSPTVTETTPATEEPTGELEGVPVYWLGQSQVRTWLYREFRTVPDVGGQVASAVSAVMTLDPQDPDYSSPWSPPSSLAVTQEGDAITVDLSADAFAGDGVGSEVAQLAVQQLIWTVTAAAQSPGPVTITVDGGSYDAWGAISLGEPMTRAPQMDVQGPIWISSPTEGQTFAPGDVTISGVSTSFEATILYEVVDESGEVVADGFTMGGANGEYAPYELTVDLEPGTYTVHVFAEDASGGESPEGPRMFEQDRTFTVE